MGTMLVLVLTTGVTFLATFSPPGSVAATAEGYLYPSSSPLPPGIATPPPGAADEVVTTLSSTGEVSHHKSIWNNSIAHPHGEIAATPDAEAAISASASIATLSSSVSLASGVIPRGHSSGNLDEIDTTDEHFSTGEPIKRKFFWNERVSHTTQFCK